MSMRLLFLGLTLVACNGDDTDSEDPGAAIYTSSCSACHGADGSGVEGVGPDLSTVVADKTAADVEAIITGGSGNMTAISGLSEEQTADVAAYVIAEWGS